MKHFNPSPKTLVVNELVEKGYNVDYDDALRLCHELEEEEQTDGKIAIGLTAVGIVGAGVTLAFCGAVAPLLVPIAAIGVGMSGVWNHPIRASRRDDEADFLRANPAIVPLIEAKLQSGEAIFKITAAYSECVRAWRATGQPLTLAATKSGEIAVNHPTSDDVKAVGSVLCDRLAGQRTVLEQVLQRVNAGDVQGGLKMAIESAGLTPASFVEQFPGKGHVYDWATGAIAAVIPSSEKAQTVEEYLDSTKPDRDVESAVRQAQSVTTPTKADILKMPLPDRADYLLKLLADYGCDLRNLIGRPTLAAGGLQRSGKTTLLLLVGIFEKAKGNNLFYITRDNDLYPIAFDGYANGSIEDAMSALFALNTKINAGSMGSLSGQTWVLDEFSTISGLLPKPKQAEFWGMALTGFAKQGGRVRFAVHHKTAGANGLPPGQAETFKAEVKMLWTDRTELSDGTYQPSGQYELLQEVGGYYKASGQTFQIPDWLLTDTNPAWHNAPCPVRSLLLFFPEFDTRKGAIAHPLNELKPKDPFKSTQAVKPQVHQDLENYSGENKDIRRLEEGEEESPGYLERILTVDAHHNDDVPDGRWKDKAIEAGIEKRSGEQPGSYYSRYIVYWNKTSGGSKKTDADREYGRWLANHAIVKPQVSDDPWQEQEYDIHTKEMNIESIAPNPKIDKLISDLQNNSKDARSPAFISWLKTLCTGQSVDEAAIDPKFLQIARFRKIISKEGVII